MILTTATPTAQNTDYPLLWSVYGAANAWSALSDTSDASYVHSNSSASAYGQLECVGPTAGPGGGYSLHRTGFWARWRRPSGYRYAAVGAAGNGATPLQGYGLDWYETEGWKLRPTLETYVPLGLNLFYFDTFGDPDTSVDVARIVAQYDWRRRPDFTVTPDAGTGRNPLVQVSGLDLDGLPARGWKVTVSGPMSWEYSGTGAWPLAGVTVDECPDGDYDVSVTISTTLGVNIEYATTKTGTFTVDSALPLSYVQDTAFKGSLADHFDMTCNSVGGLWYCAADGVLQFARQPGADYLAHFSDRHDPDDPLTVPYTGISLSYDTRNLVNDLDVTNHGAVWDAGAGAYVPADAEYAYRDGTSVASWGQRSDSIEVCVYDVSGSLEKRTKALVSKYSRPGIIVQSVTFNTADAPWAALLDLYSKVRIERKGALYGALVVGIRHSLSGDRWLTTLNLMKD